MNCYPCRTLKLTKLEKIEDLSRRPAEEILRKAALFFNLEVNDIRGKSRRTNLVFARVMITDVIKNYPYCEMSLNEIGDLFGGRDHSSIIHYRRVMRDLMSYDQLFRQRYEMLHNHIFGSLKYYIWQNGEI